MFKLTLLMSCILWHKSRVAKPTTALGIQGLILPSKLIPLTHRPRYPCSEVDYKVPRARLCWHFNSGIYRQLFFQIILKQHYMYLVSFSLSQPFHIVPQTGDVANLEARKSWERITMCFIIRFTRFLYCDCCHTVPMDKFHVFVGTECRPDSFLVSAKFHRFSIDCKGRKRGDLQRSESNLASNMSKAWT